MYSMKNFVENLCHVLEYFLAFMFIQGAVRILAFGADPVALPGFFSYLVGDVAIVVYALSWLVMGSLLIYSKWFSQPKVHKWSLFAMYVTCVYVLALSVAINGIVIGQLLSLSVGIIAAGLWLRWKVRTEYMTKQEEVEFFTNGN